MREVAFLLQVEMAEAMCQALCFPAAQRMLDDKRKKAAHYNVTMPLWFVMNITDRHGIWYETIKLFAESKPAIDPFERVHIIYRDALVTIFEAMGFQTLLLKSDRPRI